jgi:hypothetical protein
LAERKVGEAELLAVRLLAVVRATAQQAEALHHQRAMTQRAEAAQVRRTNQTIEKRL